MYALVDFVHFDRDIHAGDQVADDDELVALRPDLFTTDPPAKPRKTTKKEA